MALIDFCKKTKETPSNDVVFNGDVSKAVVDGNGKKGLELLLEHTNEISCRHFVTDGNWSLFDFLLKLTETRSIQELYITTYSMTEQSARIIGTLVVDKKIEKVYLLMDYKAEMRYPNVHQILRNVGTVGITKLHAKVMIVKFDDEHYYTLIGSANWTKNQRVEAGILDNNPVTAKQHINWITKKLQDESNNR